METKMIIEIFGYIGSILVVVSMLMSSIVKLRVINTVGSIISGVYAIICGAIPLALMNVCLITINAISLYKLLHTKQSYDLVDGNADDSVVKYFLSRYAEDIKQYFPSFKADGLSDEKAYVVCCDGAFAGVLIGKVKDGILDIVLDYSTPAYRDCSVGAYLYGKLPKMNIRTLTFSQSETDEHVAYLTKMGFKKENGVYVNNL